MQHEKNASLDCDVARAVIAEMMAHGDKEHWNQKRDPFVRKIRHQLGDYAFAEDAGITGFPPSVDFTVVAPSAAAPSTTFVCVAPIVGSLPSGSFYRTTNPDAGDGEPDLAAGVQLTFTKLMTILERWVEDREASDERLSQEKAVREKSSAREVEAEATILAVREMLKLASKGELPVISEETRLTKYVTLENGQKLVFELHDDGHPDVGPHIRTAFMEHEGRRYEFEDDEIQRLSMQFVSGYADAVASAREAESHWLESFPFKAHLSEGLFNFATAPQTVRQAFFARLEEYGDLPAPVAHASPEERAKVIQEIELAFEDVEVAFALVPRATVAEAIQASWAWQTGSATWGGLDWEGYEDWYLRNHHVPDYPRTNRWPVILSAKGADEVFEDGWHRYHSYLKNGHETIPVVAFHPAAAARAVRQLRMTFRNKVVG